MFVIWHDNDYDLARWVYLNSSLSKIGEKVLLRPIPKTNSSGTLLRSLTGDFDHHILPVIKYETPDIIIQRIDEKSRDSEVIFVTEFMTHTVNSHANCTTVCRLIAQLFSPGSYSDVCHIHTSGRKIGRVLPICYASGTVSRR